MRKLALTLVTVVAAGAVLLAASASDNFNRADNTTLGSNWIDISSDFGIASNQADQEQANNGSDAFAYWNTATNTFGADQFSQVTCAAYGAGGNVCGVTLRFSGSTFNSSSGYFCNIDGLFNAYNIRTFNGSSLGTLANGGATATAGDVIYCQISGTTITMKQNGATIATVTDSTYSSGQPGLYAGQNFSLTTLRLDDWSGGDLGGSPTFPAAIINAPIHCCRQRTVERQR